MRHFGEIEARLNSFGRPKCMLDHERLVIVLRSGKRRQVFLCPDISERDANIAEEAAALRSPNGRAAKKVPELFIVERKKIT